MSIPATRSLALVAGIAVVIAATASAASGGLLAAPAVTPNPVFEGITPVRVFDTRDGRGGHLGPLGPTETATFTIAGANGIPVDSTAVTINVTALNATEQTHLTVWPAGTERPEASNLNPASGLPDPNLVTVKVGDGGAISVFNNSGRVDVFGDVVGYHRDHDHDDRYPTRAEVDAAVGQLGSTVSSLEAARAQDQATISSLQAETAALQALVTRNDPAGSLLDLADKTATREVIFPISFNGQHFEIAGVDLEATLEGVVPAAAIDVRVTGGLQCSSSGSIGSFEPEAKIAVIVNGIEAEPRTKVAYPSDFTWQLPVSGPGPYTVGVAIWTDDPPPPGAFTAYCGFANGHLRAKLVR